MEDLRQFIADWLDPLGVVLGLVVLVPVLWTWWEVVIGRRRRERRWFAEISRQPGRRPAILIVDLLPGRDVRASVEAFRQADAALADIPPDRVIRVHGDHHLTPQEMPRLYEQLRAAAAQLLHAGADTVHYFHAGPAIVAAAVGAEFANGARVLLYQYDSGTYRCFGPLRKA